MANESALLNRCGGKCELCSAEAELATYEIPESEGHSDNIIMLCANCSGQAVGATALDANHWRCLNDSMWSAVPAVQVMAFRMLHKLNTETWAQDLLDMLYLDEDLKQWAEAGIVQPAKEGAPTKDSNGAILQAGDTVTIIKDLNVKGTSFTAKRGTAVRNISLTDNPEHIEGRVNGTRIVILSCYVKKS